MTDVHDDTLDDLAFERAISSALATMDGTLEPVSGDLLTWLKVEESTEPS